MACTRRKFPGTKRYCGRGGEDGRRSDASPWVVGDVLVGLVERLRRAAPEKKLVIEVATLAVATVAAAVGFDVIQAEKSAPAEIALLLRERQQRARDRVPLSQSPLVGLSGRRTVWQGTPARGKVLDDEGRKPSDVQRRTYEFCSIGDSRASHVVEKSHDNSPAGKW